MDRNGIVEIEKREKKYHDQEKKFFGILE